MDSDAKSSDQTLGATQASEAHGFSTNGTTELYIDPVLEKRVLAKFDRWVLPQFAIMNLIVYIDRSNIGRWMQHIGGSNPSPCNLANFHILGNANVFGYPESLGLVGNQFGNLTTLFYVTYVLFEVPWAIGVKRFGLNKIVAISFVSFGLITLGHGFAHNYGQAMACRLLLGLFEAGAAPAISFFISTVYPREHQSKRMAIIYISSALSGAFGGLIAYGIQQMGERRGLEAWRWLFIIEGVFTIVVFAMCWFSLPRTAEDAWFLSSAERELMMLRKKRDIAYKGGDDKFQWRYLLLVAKDPMVWIAAVSLFGAGVCLFGFATFLPVILTGQGYCYLSPLIKEPLLTSLLQIYLSTS